VIRGRRHQVEDIDTICIDEDDPRVNPIGAKGLGEIGIVGTAAAIANAVYHATGIRIRDLPIRQTNCWACRPDTLRDAAAAFARLTRTRLRVAQSGSYPSCRRHRSRSLRTVLGGAAQGSRPSASKSGARRHDVPRTSAPSSLPRG
jgi:hypothetical protein